MVAPNREKEAALSLDRLREVLAYDPETGVFRWKVRIAIRCMVGSVAGSAQSKYRQIVIDGRTYNANRLAWRYMTGEWPVAEIDHRDKNQRNDRFDNLRPCTSLQNAQNKGKMRNNSSGVTGVSWNKSRGKWHAYIRVNRSMIHLGLFDNIEDAAAARASAKMIHHPFASMPKPSGLILPPGVG